MNNEKLAALITITTLILFFLINWELTKEYKKQNQKNNTNLIKKLQIATQKVENLELNLQENINLNKKLERELVNLESKQYNLKQKNYNLENENKNLKIENNNLKIENKDLKEKINIQETKQNKDIKIEIN